METAALADSADATLMWQLPRSSISEFGSLCTAQGGDLD